MNTKKYFVYGAGGLGHELQSYVANHFMIDHAPTSGDRPSVALVDDSVIGPGIVTREQLSNAFKRGFVEGVWIGVGHPEARERLFRWLMETGFPLPAFVASTVRTYAGSRIQPSAIVCDNCVLTVDVVVGENTFINLNCTIGHGTKIGPHCVINPGCNVSGDVTIGSRCLIGTGATILQGVRIGDRAIIGAGAVVTRDVPAEETWIGVPARPRQS